MDSWTYRSQHSDEQAAFDRAMVSLTGNSAAAVADGYDFGRYGCVVDVGGGKGAPTAALFVRYPTPTAVLIRP